MLAMVLAACVASAEPADLARDGTVATLCTPYEGTPFGSLTPYVLDAEGNPVVFLSDLAVHTKNLKKRPECSLMVVQVKEKDLFNSPRMTFVGKMAKVGRTDDLKKAYLKRHPNAETFIDFEDFNFYRMEASKLYYVGEFGDIRWVKVDKYRKGFK